VFRASQMGPIHSCIETMTCPPLSRGSWWTDTSLSCHPEGACWLVSSLRRRDIKLSAYCTATRSSNVRISR
jgi:hypothetical protein